MLSSAYDVLNVFDGTHLGTARAIEERIVSPDTPFRAIPAGDHVDRRDIA